MIAELNYLIDGPLMGILITLLIWVILTIVNRAWGYGE